MPAQPIFIGGTGSHAGKSWVATALCRYLFRMGCRVAPFKAQNMSNNSAVCPGGGEIGRAQAAQAEACGLEPHPDMNPILLKPTGRLGSQVVLHGRPWKNLKAAEYYAHFDSLLPEVLASYERLARDRDYVVIEGAGSVTELNLKHRDLVNLGLAARLGAPCILVADIDRGGVFASVAGTFHLLDETEAPLVRSFLINRFRGDMALFAEGARMLEKITQRPCLGVFPYAADIHLDPEDSVSLDDTPRRAATAADPASGRVAIVRLPHISNFSDFRLLPEAVYVARPTETRFDFIFLPGTKSTIEDMLWLRSSGLADWIHEQVRHGARVIGVCGGFQMLGEEIVDPHHVESAVERAPGLALLPARTEMRRDKRTREVDARTASGIPFRGYEIHTGVTTLAAPLPPFAVLADGAADGAHTPYAVGTYLHGALEHPAVLNELLGHAVKTASFAKDAQYDRLADWFIAHVNDRVLGSEYLRRG